MKQFSIADFLIEFYHYRCVEDWNSRDAFLAKCSQTNPPCPALTAEDKIIRLRDSIDQTEKQVNSKQQAFDEKYLFDSK